MNIMWFSVCGSVAIQLSWGCGSGGDTSVLQWDEYTVVWWYVHTHRNKIKVFHPLQLRQSYLGQHKISQGKGLPLFWQYPMKYFGKMFYSSISNVQAEPKFSHLHKRCFNESLIMAIDSRMQGSFPCTAPVLFLRLPTIVHFDYGPATNH